MIRRSRVAAAICVATASVTIQGCGDDGPDAGIVPDPIEAAVGVTVVGCRNIPIRGSGMMIEPGRVLTSAHVLRGARSIEVFRAGITVTGEIVAFDPDMDLAVLAVDPALAPAMPLVDRDHVDEGQTATALVIRDRQPMLLPVRVRRHVAINTEDIYIDVDARRPGWELDAVIEVGDSGGLVVVEEGAIGVIWSRSRGIESRAYAIDPVEGGDRIRQQLDDGELGDVDLARCH